jgi:simple sugar transport system substrate-binding protein
VKQGSDAAAKAFGINYQYIAPANLSNFVPDYTALIREALARHPAALVIGNYVPSAFDPLIKQATSSRIPVVIMDTGLTSWQSNGAITFVGNDTTAIGAIAGQEALAQGIRHLLCINGAPVNPSLGALCNAAKQKMEAAGGTLTELDIPTADASNPSVVQQDIQGVLASHPEIDGIQGVGGDITPAEEVAALKAAGKTGSVKAGVPIVSTPALNYIKSGEVAWALDEQPYLEGFMSLLIAYEFVQFGVTPTAPVMTGGLVVDKNNVDAVLAVQKAYPGLRGTN